MQNTVVVYQRGSRGSLLKLFGLAGTNSVVLSSSRHHPRIQHKLSVGGGYRPLLLQAEDTGLYRISQAYGYFIFTICKCLFLSQSYELVFIIHGSEGG